MKHHIFYLIIVLTVLSCQNSKSKEADFICEAGNGKIVLQIENDQNFLTYDVPLKANFIVTDIDPTNLRISGTGIKILGMINEAPGMRTEIKVPSNYLDSDTLTVKVWYDYEDNNNICEFKIPVQKDK